MGWGWKDALPFLPAVNMGFSSFVDPALDYFGAEADRKAAQDVNRKAAEEAEKNRQMQIEFAKNGVRWRVEDATAAGLHPLAALGASGASYSGGSTSYLPESRGGSYRALSRMGQDASRAMMAMATPEEKEIKRLQLDRLKTDNLIAGMELLERKKRLLDSVGTGDGPGTNAGYSIGGQSDGLRYAGRRIDLVPNRITYDEPGAPQQTAGASSMFDMYKTKRGFLGLLNQKAAESTEDDWLAKIGIHLQSLLSGAEGPQKMTRNFRVPSGYDRYAYGGPVGGYAPVKRGSRTVWEAIHDLGREGREWWRASKYEGWRMHGRKRDWGN